METLWYEYNKQSNLYTELAMRTISKYCEKKKNTIKKVIFNDPATIVYWTDGTKTVVKRQPGDKKFDPEKGLAMAYVKHKLGLKEFNKLLENAEVHNGKKK